MYVSANAFYLRSVYAVISSRAGCTLASARSPFGPSDVTEPVPAVSVVEGHLGDEGGRTHLRVIFLVLVCALSLGLLLVHLVLEVGQVLPIEEGVALDRQGRAMATTAFSAPLVALDLLPILLGRLGEFVVEGGLVHVARTMVCIWPV